MSFNELGDLLTVRPLSMPPGPRSDRRSQFSAPMRQTVALLTREIKQLRPRQTVLEADFAEHQLRLDGLPRSGATPASPGIILTLIGTPYGDLRYPCSTYRHWEENLRAIALALESLRAVDRYGVTKRGEQYAGWKQLESGEVTAQHRGLEIIERYGSVDAAMKATHPDHGGDQDDFIAVMAAREIAVA